MHNNPHINWIHFRSNVSNHNHKPNISQSHLFILHFRFPVTRLLWSEGRFDLLEATQIKPRAEEHEGEIEDAKDPRNAVIKPDFGVEHIEPTSLLLIRIPSMV